MSSAIRWSSGSLARMKSIALRSLRRIVLACLREFLKIDSFEIGIQIVSASRMIRLNEQYLQHAGSTDVITFDYRADCSRQRIFGEIYVCVDEAIIQANR